MNNIWPEPDWVNFGQRSDKDLATQLFMYPEARLPTLCSSRSQPTHNSITTPTRLAYSTEPTGCLLHWAPASHCALLWTLPSGLRPQPGQGANLFTARALEYFSKWPFRLCPCAALQQEKAPRRVQGVSSLLSVKIHSTLYNFSLLINVTQTGAFTI